jgi:GntR family transcriptional regulator
MSDLRSARIDTSAPIPLFEQVAAEIRRVIAAGEAGPGDRLPPARDLAAVLGVNANTVLRSLRVLRDEGLLEFRRGRGVTVAGGAGSRSLVLEKARELLDVARREGYRRDDVVALIEQLP